MVYRPLKTHWLYCLDPKKYCWWKPHSNYFFGVQFAVCDFGHLFEEKIEFEIRSLLGMFPM
jgi:hypothetical protein